MDGGYGKLLDSYWRGPTGRAIQMHGAAAVILGAYLTSVRHANMIGLYELPLLYIDHDLPVLLQRATILHGFAGLAEVGYAFYDTEAEMVWVVEMARIRCGLKRDEALDVRDKRHPAILRWYHTVRPTRLLDQFYTRYVDQLHLGPRRIIEAPSKPLASPFDGPPMPDSRQQTVDQQTTDHGKNALRARPHPVEKPKPKVPTLAALIRDEVLPRGYDNPTDLAEAAKRAAAKRRLAYDGRSIAAAIDSAKAQASKRKEQA